jgi:flagellar protein FlbT
MPGLVLELKQDELIIINGAAIRFRSKSRIEISGKARFLFGKQILPEDDATSPARRIYHAIQTAYIGDSASRAAALEQARSHIAAFLQDSASPLARDILQQVITLAESDQCYEALKLARRVIRHEAAQSPQSAA